MYAKKDPKYFESLLVAGVKHELLHVSRAFTLDVPGERNPNAQDGIRSQLSSASASSAATPPRDAPRLFARRITLRLAHPTRGTSSCAAPR
ncbi:MAG: hypothetical protein AB1352_01825 [Patescibacteria group bacterium]